MATIEEARFEATKNQRVCPNPSRWNHLYSLLPNTARKGNGWEPALPLIVAAWHESSDSMKASRLNEHLEWAEKHDQLDKVYAYLVSLPEDEWHHSK